MENQQENNNQEIDLIYLARKIKELFTSFCFFILRFFKFLYSKKLIIILLLIVGLGVGYYLDSLVKKEFKTEVVVVPNFESVDVLYSEIENFSTNLKTNSIKNPFLKDVLKIEIKPVENINNLLQEKENLEIFKILTENGQDLSKLLTNDQIKKSYKYQLLTIRTNSDKNSTKIVDYLLNTINKKSYYLNRSKLAIANQKEAKLQTEMSIDQINKILENMGNGNLSGVGKDLSINNYDQLSNVIELKNFYLKELAKINVKLIEFNVAVYPVDTSYNNKISQRIYQKNIVLLPAGLFIIFLIISYIKYFYNKYNRLYSNK